MNRKIIVDISLEVNVNPLIQFNMPGLLYGTNSKEDIHSVTKYFGELIRESNKLEDFYVLESLLTSKDENVILCFMGLTCNRTFKISDGLCSTMNVVWLQKNYAFPIDQDILDKLKVLPFRELSKEEGDPFVC